jgi:hypothetical protein
VFSYLWNTNQEASAKQKIDFFRSLAVKLGDWISQDDSGTRNQLVTAVRYAVAEYDADREGILETVSGSQDPVPVSAEGGVIANVSWGAQTFLQGVRSLAANYVVAPSMTDSADQLRKKFREGITNDTIVPILLYLREEIERGWTSDRFGRRTSLNTLIVFHVVKMFLNERELSETKAQFSRLCGERASETYFRQHANDAFKFYLIVLGRLNDTGCSARFSMSAQSA